jgi:hypothetical protein
VIDLFVGFHHTDDHEGIHSYLLTGVTERFAASIVRCSPD